MPVRAIRGATTVDTDTPEQIKSRVLTLMTALMEHNCLVADDVVSMFVTATADITSFHPATAARAYGLPDVAILGAQELGITDSLARCVRILLHVETERRRDQLEHVFLEGAVVLRPDLVKQ